MGPPLLRTGPRRDSVEPLTATVPHMAGSSRNPVPRSSGRCHRSRTRFSGSGRSASGSSASCSACVSTSIGRSSSKRTTRTWRRATGAACLAAWPGVRGEPGSGVRRHRIESNAPRVRHTGALAYCQFEAPTRARLCRGPIARARRCLVYDCPLRGAVEKPDSGAGESWPQPLPTSKARRPTAGKFSSAYSDSPFHSAFTFMYNAPTIVISIATWTLIDWRWDSSRQEF